MSQPMLEHTALLAEMLRGDVVPVERFSGIDPDDLHRAVIVHDVVALLAAAATAQPSLPDTLRRRLEADAQREVALDLLREAELRRTLTAIKAAGVTAIVIKGSHLAYTHYARPDLRSRTDSDLLITPSDRALVHETFTGTLGYDAPLHLTGEFTSTQQTYQRADRGGLTHQFDVHWRLTNVQAFAHALSYEEILASAVSVPALVSSALAPSNVHALVIACLHRVAHHDDHEQLRWFVDIDLLASRFTAAEWETFVAFVAERRVAGVCLHSLLRTVELLHTRIPDAVLQDPRLTSDKDSPTLEFLKASSNLKLLAADLRSLPSWKDRARLVREHLFPDADYMRQRYAPGSRAPLAWLYGVRVVKGLGRWLGPRTTPD